LLYRSREREEQRFRLEDVMSLAESSIPDFGKVVEAFWTTGSWAEAAEMVSQQRCEAVRRRFRRLRKSIVGGTQATRLRSRARWDWSCGGMSKGKDKTKLMVLIYFAD
jgi:hypothetical protein